jgi:MFS family permease
MIADLFPRARLTTAMAVYGIGATVGSGTALMIGGAIVELVSNAATPALPFIGEIRPWQAVFFLVGMPGALIAFSIFTVPEPARRGQRAAQARGGLRGAYAGLLEFVRARPRFFGCHYAGFTFASAVVTGGAAWYPAHMSRSFGWSAGDVGMALGPTLLAAGVIGKLLCGRLVDAMYQRGFRDAQMRWYGASLLVATPIGILATVSDEPWVFVGAIGVFMTLIGALQACALTALNLVTPNELRGSGVAVFTTVAGLLGGGAGPVLIAAISEHVFGGEAELGLGLAATIAICCPLGAACLLLGLDAMRRAMAEAEGTPQAPSR